MGNLLSLYSSPKNKEQSYKILIGRVKGLNDIASYKLLFMLNPSFNSDNDKSEELSQISKDDKAVESKLRLVIMGDGDYRLDEKVPDLVKSLNENKVHFQEIILSNLELPPKVFRNLLNMAKENLIALKISGCPLDDKHLDILNENNLNLGALSLNYVRADVKDAFRNAEYNPFDINQLHFSKLGKDLQFLELKGLPVKRETIGKITKAYAHSLNTFILEELKGKKTQKIPAIKGALEDLKHFKVLENFSLAGNNLEGIDFMKGDTQFVFPTTLKNLNINYCKVDNKQVNNIIELLDQSNAYFEGLYLKDTYLYRRTLNKLKDRRKDGQLPTTDMPKTIIDSIENEDILTNIDKAEAYQDYKKPLFTMLEDMYSRILQYYTEWQQSTEKGGLSKIYKREDYLQFFPVILKALKDIKFFDDAFSRGIVDFSTKEETLLPKQDFSQLLKYFHNLVTKFPFQFLIIYRIKPCQLVMKLQK